MDDRTHNDVGAKLQAMVDDGIAELLPLGLKSRDAAAEMMACQAAVRIEDNEVTRHVARFVDELVWDVDDT